MSTLSERIDTIERGYEYLLAYAAQGRRDDTGSEVRQTLSAMHAALDGLATAVAECLNSANSANSASSANLAAPEAALCAPEATTQDAAAFIDAVIDDSRKARGAIALVLSRPAISSLLVDNLNASIHLRALLTDVFLVDQALKP